jgi:hypothetical protein
MQEKASLSEKYEELHIVCQVFKMHRAYFPTSHFGNVTSKQWRSDLDDMYDVILCTILLGLTSRSGFATASKSNNKCKLTTWSACWAQSKSVKGSNSTCQNSLTTGNCKCVTTVCSFVVTSINTVSLPKNVYC